jgi:hypothetical protein
MEVKGYRGLSGYELEVWNWRLRVIGVRDLYKLLARGYNGYRGPLLLLLF